MEGFLRAPEILAAEKRRARAAAKRYSTSRAATPSRCHRRCLSSPAACPQPGKSTVARALSEQAGFEVISSDLVRKELAGIAPTEHRLEGFPVASTQRTSRHERGTGALLDRARPLLLAGRSVVLDASFMRREHRRPAARLARETGAQFLPGVRPSGRGHPASAR